MRWVFALCLVLLLVLPSVVFAAPEDDDDGDGSINRYDCDDTNANIFPENTEMCDGVDNDCDAQVDEAVSCPTNVPFCAGSSGCVECTQDSQCASNICSNNVCVLLPCPQVNECSGSSATGCSSDGSRKWSCVLGDARNDGSRCYEKEYIYCSDEGLHMCSDGSCFLSCDAHEGTPGCQFDKPTNSVLVPNKLCAQEGYACYTCPDNMIWRKGICEDKGMQIENVQDMWVEQGTVVAFDPRTIDNSNNEEVNALYSYSGLFTTQKQGVVEYTATQIGSHTLTITAYSLLGTARNELVSKTITVTVICSANQACCPEGEPRYAKKGTVCELDGSQGTCSANGVCAPRCQEQPEASAFACSDGVDNDCDGIADCSILNGRTESGCKPFCETYCVLPLRACGASCSDLQSDRNNCGACGTTCGKEELCEQGVCQAYEGCFVACSQDDECQGICKNPGTCTAYCQAPTSMSMQEQQILLALLVKEETIVVQKAFSDDTLTFSILNLVGTPLHDVEVYVTIPPALFEVFREAKNSHSYEHINDGSTLHFHFDTLEYETQVTFSSLSQTLQPFLSQIIIDYEHESFDSTQVSFLSSTDVLFVTEKTPQNSLLSVSVLPQRKLEYLRAPIRISSCAHPQVMQSESSLIRISDGLFVYTASSLQTKQEILFSLDEEQGCSTKVEVFGLGEAKNPLSPLLFLLIIPLIGLLLIVGHFVQTSSGAAHMSKDEFTALARQQGQNAEQIERSWHEYKRKF